VGIIDKSGYFTEQLIAKINGSDTTNTLTLIKDPEDVFKTTYDSLGYNGYIVIPQNASWKKGLDSLSFNTDHTYGIGATAPLESKLNKAWAEIKNDSLGIDATKKQILAASNISLKINNTKIHSDAGAATVIGYVCGF
jgi:hypothetical protein